MSHSQLVACSNPYADGPPLRATAMIAYANWLIDNGNTTWVNQRLWPVIKNDLDYTAKFWNYTGFDLWEEISSASFFTTAVQHRALREGATLATKLGQSSAATSYLAQAPNVLCFLQVCLSSTHFIHEANLTLRATGTQAKAISLPTPEVAALARTPTLFSLPFTPLISTLDAMPPPSNRVQTRLSQTTRPTLTHSARSIPSTVVSPQAKPLPPVATPRTSTMVVSHGT
jgi:Glycosyl hydrolases family 15